MQHNIENYIPQLDIMTAKVAPWLVLTSFFAFVVGLLPLRLFWLVLDECHPTPKKPNMPCTPTP